MRTNGKLSGNRSKRGSGLGAVDEMGPLAQAFQRKHRGAELPLKAWFDEVRAADWRTPAEVKAQYRKCGR